MWEQDKGSQARQPVEFSATKHAWVAKQWLGQLPKSVANTSAF